MSDKTFVIPPSRFEFDWQILDYCEELNHDGWSGAAFAHECALELLKARRELRQLRAELDALKAGVK